MKYKTLLATLLLSPSLFAANEPATAIKIFAPQWKDSTLFLCSYFNGALYKADSIRLSAEGRGTFESPEAYPEGQYAILLNQHRYFDVLLSDDQRFSIALADTGNLVGSNKIEGAPQSEAFLEYARYLFAKQEERRQLSDKAKEDPSDAQQAHFQSQMNRLNEEVEHFMDHFQQQYAGRWVGDYFKGVQPVEGPHPSPKTQEEYLRQVNYLNRHYFDRINLQDVRFWRTNYFPEKIDAYLNHIVYKHPDSLANAASRLVARTLGDTLCFRLMLSHLVNYSANNKIMGMENIWAKLAEDYIFNKRATWVDSAYYATLDFEYRKIRYNRIGMSAADLKMQRIDGQTISLLQLRSDYVLVYFFEPSCSHCRKTTPPIHDKIYHKYKSKGFEVFCVYTMTDRDEWLKFIEEHHLEDWINVWDPDRKSYFWLYYDTSVTPGVYLLDKSRKIIAKKLDEESLDKVLESIIK
ncbi:MAG: redoxin domain-containing protein [Dysgonamonadaceae bacterium]|jgi:peroxiredoxin|nr:redoxin domain-containing protein [Dysgonamonadaceae bacterium]